MEDGHCGVTGGHVASHVELVFTHVLELAPTQHLLHLDSSVKETYKMFNPAFVTIVNCQVTYYKTDTLYIFFDKQV